MQQRFKSAGLRLLIPKDTGVQSLARPDVEKRFLPLHREKRKRKTYLTDKERGTVCLEAAKYPFLSHSQIACMIPYTLIYFPNR